jgi:hypothetical protein
MITRKILILLICISVLPIITISCSKTDNLKINRDMAIMIASASLPSGVTSEASVFTLWDDSKWTVHFMLENNEDTIAKNELGWAESPDAIFESGDDFPENNYRLLTITIDRKTGMIISRKASNSFLLGGPGTFNTEPPKPILIPIWLAIISGFGGLGIGGVGMWLIMQRKKVTR